jgi:hypothetical protein
MTMDWETETGSEFLSIILGKCPQVRSRKSLEAGYWGKNL